MTVKLYDLPLSGNCWKVRLCLHELHRAYERITLDPAKGDLQAPEFHNISPRLKTPVLVDEGRPPLIESGAILVYLARGSNLLPDEPVAFAENLAWLFWEQADLCPPLARPRFFKRIGQYESRADEVARYLEDGRGILAYLDGHLAEQPFLTGEDYALADLACHVYVLLAPEGGHDLAPYSNVTAWLDRIRSRPDWVPLLPDA